MGLGCVILVNLSDLLTFEQKNDGGKRLSRTDIWGRVF